MNTNSPVDYIIEKDADGVWNFTEKRFSILDAQILYDIMAFKHNPYMVILFYGEDGTLLKEISAQADLSSLERNKIYDLAQIEQAGAVFQLDELDTISAIQDVEPIERLPEEQATLSNKKSAQGVLTIESDELFSLTEISDIEIVDMSTPYQSTLIDVNAETVSQNAAEIVLDDGTTLNALIIFGDINDAVDIDDAVLDSAKDVQYQSQHYTAYDLGDVSVLIADEINVI